MDLSLANRGTSPVFDPRIWKTLGALTAKTITLGADGNPEIRGDFTKTFRHWIGAGSEATAIGLGAFPEAYFVNGVTQGYDVFLYEHKGRRFRMLKGEYPYVQLSVDRWRYLEDEAVVEGDAVVLSMPSYRDGGVPRRFSETLDQCRRRNVPVFIDAAYFGTCFGVSFHFDHPAIEMVGFSLSKPFHIHSYRCGVLFARRTIRHLHEIQVNSGYFNRVGAFVGLSLMREFSSDYMPSQYRDRYSRACESLNVTQTNCIMLASVRDDDRRFDEVLRDDRFKAQDLPEGVPRRVCVSAYVSAAGSPLRRIARRAKNFVRDVVSPSS